MNFITNFTPNRTLEQYERKHNLDPKSMLALYYNYGLISLDEMQTICKLMELGALAGLIK